MFYSTNTVVNITFSTVEGPTPYVESVLVQINLHFSPSERCFSKGPSSIAVCTRLGGRAIWNCGVGRDMELWRRLRYEIVESSVLFVQPQVRRGRRHVCIYAHDDSCHTCVPVEIFKFTVVWITNKPFTQGR